MLKPTRQVNKHVQDVAESFMSGSSNSDHAQYLVKERIEEFKGRGLTKQEITNWLSRRGYLKTETDRKIVEGELRKAKVFDSNADEWEYEKRLAEKIRRQALVNQISGRMAYEGMKERNRIIEMIKNKKSKYL